MSDFVEDEAESEAEGEAEGEGEADEIVPRVLPTMSPREFFEDLRAQRADLIRSFYSRVRPWAHREQTNAQFNSVVFVTGEVLGSVPMCAASPGTPTDADLDTTYFPALLGTPRKDTSTYIALYGENERGQSVAVLVDGWYPWFRVRGSVAAVTRDMAACSIRFKNVVSHGQMSTFYGFTPASESDPLVAATEEYSAVYFSTLGQYYFAVKRCAAVGIKVTDTVQSPFDKFCCDVGLKLGVAYNHSISFVGPQASERWSHCQFETDGSVDVAKVKMPESDQFMPRLISVSFDAEMMSYSGRFPEPFAGDHTICVAAQVSDSEKLLAKYLLCVGSCDPIDGTEVFCFSTALDLYEALRYLVVVVADAFVVLGWNCFGFDFPYACTEVFQATREVSEHTHAVARVCAPKGWTEPDPKEFARDFPYLREPRDLVKAILPKELSDVLKLAPTTAFEVPEYYRVFDDPIMLPNFSLWWFWGRRRLDAGRKIASKAEKGQIRKMYWPEMRGRLPLDLMVWCRSDPTLRMEENTLRYAAQRFLDPDKLKIDLPPSEIFAIYTRDSAARKTIGEYCVRDAEIPAMIALALKVYPFLVQLAKVTHLSIEYLAHYGTMRQVLTSLMWKARAKRIVLNLDETLPTLRRFDGSFPGATVLKPIVGLSEHVIALDYQQLYPSIMMGFGVSPNRWLISDVVPPCLVGKVDSYTFDRLGTTHIVREDPARPETKGIMSLVLEDLTKARRAAKAEMESLPPGFARNVKDREQAALKVISNTVYGFVSASTEMGLLPWLPGGAIVTHRGRTILADTRKFIEDAFGATVIYGDTDSLMFKLPTGGEDIERRGAEIAEAVTARLPRPLKMNFEAVHTMLALKPKMYACYTREVKPDGTLGAPKVKIKGLSPVRRDRPRVLRDTAKKCLESILKTAGYDGMISILESLIETFVNDDSLPLSMFAQTCYLKDLAEYTEDNTVSAAYKRLLPLNDPRTPSQGTRVKFVFLAPPRIKSDAKMSDLSSIVLDDAASAAKVYFVYYLEHIFSTVMQFAVGAPDVVAKLSKMLESGKTRIISRRNLGIKRGITSFFQPVASTAAAAGRELPDALRDSHTSKKPRT